MANRNTLGGVIHTYQQYDPRRFPSPTEPPPDMVSAAFEHMLMFGERRELTEEELARAIRIDPSQISGLGPSLDALLALLKERKRKILARYETRQVRQRAHSAFADHAQSVKPPPRTSRPISAGGAARTAARIRPALVRSGRRSIAVCSGVGRTNRNARRQISD